VAPILASTRRKSSYDNWVGVAWDMTSVCVHSPLETLLLFQTLQPYAGNPPSFEKVSSELKNNEILRDRDSSDNGRLEPESLRELYLRILREEVKLEVTGTENAGSDMKSQHNSRKRKISRPPLETESDAPQYSYLLPRATKRLYFRYRDHAVKAIEEQERKYRLVQRDIQEITRGEWDARLQHQEIANKRDPKRPSSIQTLLRSDEPAEEKPRVGETHTASKSPVQQSITATLPEASNPSSSENVLVQQPTKEANGQGSITVRQDAVAVSDVPPQSQESVSVEATLHNAPPVSAPEAQRAPSIAQDSRSISQPTLPQSARLPPPTPQYASSGYSLGSPKAENPRLSHSTGQPRTGVMPIPSPRIAHPPMTLPDPSASPIILPPPPGMLRSSGSPNGPLDALADMAGQHRSSPTLSIPRPAQSHGVQPHPVQLPQPRNYAQRAYPYYDSQSPYPVAYHPYGQNALPPYHTPNHGIVPGYRAAGPNPGQGPHFGNHSQYQSPLPPYYPLYNQSPPYYQPTPGQAPYSQNPPLILPDQRTPIVTPIGRQRPPRPSPINTSASSTKWKDIEIPGSVRSEVARPGPDEISPISERAPSPALEISKIPSKATKGKEGKKDAKKESLGKKSQIGGSQQGRAASTASSAVAGSLRTRTRSQSIASPADELSLDTTPAPSRKVKPEPPATPARDDDTSITETTADEGGRGSRKSTRRRRETLRGLESMTELTRSTSAKHGNRPSVLDEPTAQPQSSTRPNQVLGSRNFPRTSATIMNDITGHKLASMFAKPLTEREAPGYKDLIYRSQDLKSIKSAIAAGARAVANAAENASTSAIGDTGSPGTAGTTPMTKTTSSSTLWLPARDDVVPPKGIVNSAQLEKELMRMFANAVMFNPDPKRGVGPAFRTRSKISKTQQGQMGADNDAAGVGEEPEEGGVVHDAREMCREVERRVAEWRAAEMKGRRREEGAEADELAVEEEEGGAKKRRR